MTKVQKKYLSLKTGKIVKSKSPHTRAEITNLSEAKEGQRYRIELSEESAYATRKLLDIQNRAIAKANLEEGLLLIKGGNSIYDDLIFKDPSNDCTFSPYIKSIFKL